MRTDLVLDCCFCWAWLRRNLSTVTKAGGSSYNVLAVSPIKFGKKPRSRACLIVDNMGKHSHMSECMCFRLAGRQRRCDVRVAEVLSGGNQRGCELAAAKARLQLCACIAQLSHRQQR